MKIKKFYYITFLGMFFRGLGLIVTFFNTRYLVLTLGVKDYAVYTVIFSLFGWLSLFNFGFPIAIQNKISSYRGNGKNISKLIEHTLQLLSLVTIAGIVLLIPVSYLLYTFFISEMTSKISFSWYLIFMYTGFFWAIMDFCNRYFFAIAKGHWAHFFYFIVAFFSLFSLLILRYIQVNNIKIILLAYFSPYFFVFLLTSIYIFKGVKFKLEFFKLKQYIKPAKEYFLFSIMSAIVLKIDYMISSLVLTADHILTYNIDMKIFMVMLFFYSTLLSFFWPAARELIIKGYPKLALKKMYLNIISGVLFTLVIASGVFLFEDKIFGFLTGNKIHSVSNMLILTSLLYVIIRIWSDSFATYLQSYGRLKELIFMVPFQAIFSAIFQYFLGRKYGAEGIVLGISLSFLLTVSWFLPFKTYKLVYRAIS